jgi:hypothetical protein
MARGSGGGPKSEDGKQVTRGNSLQHGLWSKDVVIPQLEDEREWQALVDGMMAERQPVGVEETEIVQELAFLHWRRRRIRRAENAEILKGIMDMPGMYEPTKRLRGEAVRGDTPEDAAEFDREAERRLVPSEQRMDRIIRYEAHTTRQIEKVDAELRRRQEARMQEEPGKVWVEVRTGEE